MLHIATTWALPEADRAESLIMVGDSVDDMKAGAAAGATTVLLVNRDNEHLEELAETHFCIARYALAKQLAFERLC